MTSNALPAAAAAPAPIPDPTYIFDLDDFPVYVMYGDQYDYIENVLGQNHYFILAGGHETYKKETTPPTTETKRNLKVYKVTKSAFGRAVVETTPEATGIKYGTSTNFNLFLPKIPYELFMKMDAFFREIHKQHGTEAILMLMYDTNYFTHENPSLGWGAVAPDQKNTAGFCDYDPTSVIDSLADHVMLAGSAHSHPEMSAFASGTDHQDQAGWDGIHITYGWRKHINGGATEHYVECQYAKVKWAYDLADLIETAPVPQFGADQLVEWTSNVTKGAAATTVIHGSHGSGAYSAPKYTTPGYSSSSAQSGKPGQVLHRIPIKLPNSAPNPGATMIVGTMLAGDEGTANMCPFCLSPLHDREVAQHRCFGCYSYFIYPGQTVEELNADRELHQIKAIEDLDLVKGQYPIVIWNGLHGNEAVFSADQRTAHASKKSEA